MANKLRISFYSVCLLSSVALNIYFATTPYFGKKQKPIISWTLKAAAEAEALASTSCSGHGKAYLDGLIVNGNPICECNNCYGGSDCSVFATDCAADADSGNPLFLEPFWMQHASTSAVLLSGWHRMSYSSNDKFAVSPELVNNIHKVHAIARNAITKGKYIVFGGGSTQLLGAAVYALSMNLSSPASVVAASPAYPLYKSQTDYFQNMHFEFKGDALTLNNSSDNLENVIEFVTSPNNPDGNLRRAVAQGKSVKAIYDHAYYWPHFTAIPSPANEDVMVFTISKLTGHAGSRFGWALVKDEVVYQRMKTYISLSEFSISREAQMRAQQLLEAILEGNGKEIFDFGYEKMRNRWEKLSQTIALSNHFTLQEIPNQYCNFFEKVRGPSPAYAWLKCEREEDINCNAVLKAGKIIGRNGSLFDSKDRYVRLSLLMRDDDFDFLLGRLNVLVGNEDGAKTI